SPPSTGILNRPSPLPSLPPMTIHLPSGDQHGVPRIASVLAKSRDSVPSLVSRCRRRLPFCRRTNATRRPSAETAGGSSRAAVAPLPISSTSPFSYGDTPCPPPCH